MRFFRVFFSMSNVIFFFVLFGTACAVATFVENSFGILSAKALIYNTYWFQAIMLILVILLVGNIFKYKMYKNFPSFLFHISFVIMLLGAGLTKYFGYQGVLHLKEGQTSNRVMTKNTYIELVAQKDNAYKNSYKEKIITKIANNDFKLKLNIANKQAVASYKAIVIDPKSVFSEVKDGIDIIHMRVLYNQNPQDITLKDKGIYHAPDGTTFLLNKDIEKSEGGSTVVKFISKMGKIYIFSNKPIEWTDMGFSKKGIMKPKKLYEFKIKRLYSIGDLQFVPTYAKPNSKENIYSSKDGHSNMVALLATLSYGGKTKDIVIYNRIDSPLQERGSVYIDGIKFSLFWGPKTIFLPFYIKLEDFMLERYPGSVSPSSYKSAVEVIGKNRRFNFDIYMNHVLDYQGYRFFQYSYDQDESGSVLLVNRDPGKQMSYLSYFLLFLGLFLNLINPKSRFRKVYKSLKKRPMPTLSKHLSFSFLFLSLFLLLGSHSNLVADNYINSNTKEIYSYNKLHAKLFGEVQVQTPSGRIAPLNTVAYEVLNKLSSTTSLFGLTPDQILLGMIHSPSVWQNVDMISVNDSKIKKLIGIKENQKYASFNDFFFISKGKNTVYKLLKESESANSKAPSQRTRFDNDIIKIDDKLNTAFYVYTGHILRIFPEPNSSHGFWVDPKVAIENFSNSQAIQKLLTDYFDGLSYGLKTNNWIKADDALKNIIKYQKDSSPSMVISQNKIKTEIFFNGIDVFQKLMYIYLALGLVGLIYLFVSLLRKKLFYEEKSKIFFYVTLILFLLNSLALAGRWYISGHAPWSDSYESLIYIAWSFILASLLFPRSFNTIAPFACLLSGVVLFVAHLSWINPQITTLVPVLKSYWLIIHVSVISASYGFLGINFMLGAFSLVLFSFLSFFKRGSFRYSNIVNAIKNLNKISEVIAIFGLSLLIVGNFLGSIWANESWGQLWGWDPKETWTLVTIFVYIILLHIRFLPKLKNYYFIFSLVSMLSYGSVVMTYFGVNFFFSGLHSYASGHIGSVSNTLVFLVGIVLLLSAFAFPNRDISNRING